MQPFPKSSDQAGYPLWSANRGENRHLRPSLADPAARLALGAESVCPLRFTSLQKEVSAFGAKFATS